MNDIDKWAAEQCGVKLSKPLTGFDGAYFHSGNWIADEWTINDPRCREIVREHFFIETQFSAEGVACDAYHNDVDIEEVYGKTIAEAEIACITAIWEGKK